MQITGKSGNLADVNASDQLLLRSVNVSAIHEASMKGDAYSWTAVTADINTGDTALCVANQSHTKVLVIEKVYAYSDVPCLLKIHVPVPCTWTGTAVVGVNLNREYASILADATADADETATTFADANVIQTLATNEVTTDQFAVETELHGSLVLGYDDAVAVDIIGESAAFNCTIIGYFIDK